MSYNINIRLNNESSENISKQKLSANISYNVKLSSLKAFNSKPLNRTISKFSAGKTFGTFGIAVMANMANDLKSAGITLTTDILQRVGSYTGNSVMQAQITNLNTAYTLGRQFLTNPFTSAVNLGVKYADFNLQKYKDNLEAQYQAFLLNDITKG